MSGGPRIPKPCAAGGCINRVYGPGHYCDAHKRKAKDSYDRNRPSAPERGYDERWAKARQEYLRLHPRCIYCRQPSEVVHHDPPHKGDMAKFWDRLTWRAACKGCNNRIRATQEGGFGRAPRV